MFPPCHARFRELGSRLESMRRPRIIPGALAVSAFGFLVGVSGCDTIKARSRAQDGVALYKEGKPVEAAAKFEEAQALDATVPTIWLDLGFADLAAYQLAIGMPAGNAAASRAIFAFEKYLEMRPGEERVTSYLVQTFVDTSHYDDAVKFFKPAVDRTPPDTQALATLGTIASKVGRFSDAATWYERRIAAEPDSGDARLALGVLLWDRLKSHVELVGKDRVEMSNRALAVLKEARRLQPASPNPFLYTNLVYRERANANLGDDPKRADLELANAYFRIANNVGKGGSEAAMAKDKAFVDDATPKADALVKVAVDAIPDGQNAPAPAPVAKDSPKKGVTK